MSERVLMAEIQRHHLRVGWKPEERLQWAIDFAFGGLPAVTEGDRQNLRRDLAAFSGTPQVPDARHYVTSHFVRGEIARLGHHDWQGAYGEIPTWAEVEQARGEFRKLLDRVLRIGQYTLGPFPVTYYIGVGLPTDPPRPRQSHFFERVKHEGAAWGLITLARLLGAFGSKLEQCPEATCRRLYVARRVNQHFCSTRCQSRTTTRAYRSRKREEEVKRAARKAARLKGKAQKTRIAGAIRRKGE